VSVTTTKAHARPPSDQELVDAGQRGDPKALRVLVERHQDAVFRTAMALVRDETLAADVTQDAFLKAFRALESFRGDAAFRTWLLSIARNEARGALRTRARRREESLDGVGPLASDRGSPEEDALRAREVDRARGFLAALPEKQRMAGALRVDEGLSFREIGAIIDCSEGSARVNYFHGIRKLRERMS